MTSKASNEPTDAGKHYRFQYQVKVNVPMLINDVLTINLDPFRIAKIYKMKSFAMMTILKKCLCAGERGHKDYKQDLLDIVSAANREIEIIEEDELNGVS